VIALGFLLSRARGERAVESISTKCEPGGVSSSGDPAAASGPRSGSVEEGETIQVDDVADSGRPFETVRIQGTYRGGADTLLRVQRWEEGKWLAFPVPARTDQSGQFTTYVEFGQPGRLPASRAGPGLRRDVQTFCAIDQGADRFPVALQVTVSVMGIFVICRPADEPKRIRIEPVLLTYLTEEPPARLARRLGRAS
jgi:hypothetical protein